MPLAVLNCFYEGHLQEHYHILAFISLHDRARQSRLVTKQEWLDINGKCPLTEIPGWSPWRTPAKKIFFSFENLTKKNPKRFQVPQTASMPPNPSQGIFPDVMHITHLALAPDVITSCLLDWSDDSSYFAGGSRDRRLNEMWQSYRSWCESQSYPMGERAQRKLFTSSVLKPDHGQYTEISQKVLNASAARYMLFWISSIAKQFAEWFQADSDMQLGQYTLFRSGPPYYLESSRLNMTKTETIRVTVCLDMFTSTLQKPTKIFSPLWVKYYAKYLMWIVGGSDTTLIHGNRCEQMLTAGPGDVEKHNLTYTTLFMKLVN